MNDRRSSSLRLLSICRVSSHEQEEGYSLEMQDRANRDWAERKGHTIVDTVRYVETASKQEQRWRFREIIDLIRKGDAIDGAVFHKVDRACRNLTDLAMLERLEAENQKYIFFATQEFPQNAAGRLSLGVMGVVARWYTDNLREEVNKGLRGKVEAGEYPHTPPYGYVMDGPKSRRLPVPDPPRAENIRIIFSLMASGKYSLDALKEELLQRGVYFSTRVPRWTRSYLAKVLRHPFYTGKILWRGKTYEGKHEPIVDGHTWRRVQDVLDGRNNAKCPHRRRFTYGHGLIKCAHCGYDVTAEVHKQRYTYYVCSQRRHREHPIRPAWVCEALVESQIVALLERLCLPEEVYDWAVAYFRKVSATDAADREKELCRLERKAAEAQTALDAILLRAAQADDSLAEEFMRLARQKQQEIATLQRRTEQIGSGKRENNRDPMKILELAQNLAKRYVTFSSSGKRMIAESVFSNLRLDNVTLYGDYRLPFAILAENANRPLKYARQDSNL